MVLLGFHTSLLFLPSLELFLQMLFQPRKLILVILPTSPALYIPVRPTPRMKPLTPLLQRKLIHLHQEARIEAQVMLLMLHTWRMHVPTHDVNMHMIHTRMRMRARFDLGQPVAARRQLFISF